MELVWQDGEVADEMRGEMRERIRKVKVKVKGDIIARVLSRCWCDSKAKDLKSGRHRGLLTSYLFLEAVE
jgi:hypothetical protein